MIVATTGTASTYVVPKMLVRPWDRTEHDEDWYGFVEAQSRGLLIAAGQHRVIPVVLPTRFTAISRQEITVELSDQHPIRRAIAENPTVLLSVASDRAQCESCEGRSTANPVYASGRVHASGPVQTRCAGDVQLVAAAAVGRHHGGGEPSDACTLVLRVGPVRARFTHR